MQTTLKVDDEKFIFHTEVEEIESVVQLDSVNL